MKVKASFDINRFFDGDCHNLAVALYHLFGQSGGCLSAIMRDEYDDDGELDSTTYSHMIFIDDRRFDWDLDGDDAQGKWEMLWNMYPDKYGHTSEFDTIDMQLEHVAEFLKDHDCKLDDELIKELIKLH